MSMPEFNKEALLEWQDYIGGPNPLVMVGNATCGRSAGATELIERLEEELKNSSYKPSIVEVGCVGMCFLEPIVSLYKPGSEVYFYSNVSAEDGAGLLDSFFGKDEVPDRNLIGTLGKEGINGTPSIFSSPMLKPQIRLVLNNCGIIDPTNLNHYIANKGYSGLEKSLSLQPSEVIASIEEAGLRGRGGAGFPTARKWKFAYEQQSPQKYVICNADEGDPGAFMNRSLLEGDPHSLIEGMIIAGYAIGASSAYIYCRAEYPLALERLDLALKQAEERNLLGENILNTGFNFKIKVKEGAGAFVCGEETALIASIEGKRGMPVPRPPFPAVSGLWGKPTIINNVETLASVARIMQNSPGWFSKYGSESSKGTKTFALVGKIKNTGLIEVPLGTTLREIIFDIGGGVLGDKKLKAVQTGGPSGGCVPAEKMDIPVDYVSLAEAGTIMGSGGLVVMDEDTCMVDVARYFIDFAHKESCGKCAPCRLGTKQMLDILEDIVSGEGKMEDIDLLEEIGRGVAKGSLCGLGQTAPNPVLTTIRYFRDEYVEHIQNKRCPARVCKDLKYYDIIEEKCTGCHICFKVCPVSAISGKPKELHVIDQDLCIKCGMCLEKCPDKFNAIELHPGSKYVEQ